MIPPWGSPSAPAHPGLGTARVRRLPESQGIPSCPATAQTHSHLPKCSWAPGSVSSPETTSHLMVGVPVWPRPPSSASSAATAQILPTVTFLWQPDAVTRSKTNGAEGAGGCWHCRDHPRADLAANTLVLGTGTETLPPLPTQGQGQVWNPWSCSLTSGRTGMAPSQAGWGPTRGVRALFTFSESGGEQDSLSSHRSLEGIQAFAHIPLLEEQAV